METTLNIDKQYVEKSIEDWKKRIADLYAQIAGWLEGSNYSCKLGQPTDLYEELMYEFGFEHEQLDTLVVLKDNIRVLDISPRGLWVISSNGFLEMFTKNGINFITDYAEQFETPKLQLYISAKRQREEWNKENFFKILNNL